MAIIPDGVHPSTQQVKNLVGDAIFGIPSGWRWLIGVQFGVVINEESCMGWKPHNLEGCRGLNNFFTRLGVTTELCRGDTNVSGCLGDAPRYTGVHRGVSGLSLVHPGRGSDEGCYRGIKEY